MKNIKMALYLGAMLIGLTASQTPAAAQTSGEVEAQESPMHFDVEIDPIAYIMQGYSLHVGVGWEHVRLDVGAFAMNIPEMLHANEGFGAYFDGFGLKLQAFPFAEQTGPFVGVSGGVTHPLVRLEGTQLASRDTQYGVGAQVGWRVDLPADFYVTPWVGVDYNFSAESPTLDGRTFENDAWTVFPTVHLGYKFR